MYTMTRTQQPTPKVRTLPSNLRWAAVAEHAGKQVRINHGVYVPRDVEGTLISVARTTSSGGAPVAVLMTRNGDWAVSLATINTIERIGRDRKVEVVA